MVTASALVSAYKNESLQGHYGVEYLANVDGRKMATRLYSHVCRCDLESEVPWKTPRKLTSSSLMPSSTQEAQLNMVSFTLDICQNHKLPNAQGLQSLW